MAKADQSENTEGKKAKQSRRATGPKPVYVMYKPELTEEGKVVGLEVTRDTRKVLKFLSDNPGAKVEERTLAA